MNGIVALNFSCDGFRSMPWEELLDKRLAFWLGVGDSCAGVVEARQVKEGAA